MALLGAALLSGPAATGAPTLKVGDAAPPMRVAKWLKGTPVKGFDKGKVYVVEFWATWCGPCRQTIPHLTEMAKQFKGKVTFAGISVWERPPDETRIRKFIADMGDKMAYNVGMDDARGIMASSWMSAAGQNGIPASFVVGKTGKIEWIGHPMAGLDNVLKQVLAGTFDARAAAAAREREEAEQARRAEILQPAEQAYQKKDWKGVATALDAAFAKMPDMEMDLAPVKFRMLALSTPSDAYAYGDRLANGLYKDKPEQMGALVSQLVKTPDIKDPDYAWAIKTGEAALGSLKSNDTAYFVLADSVALAYDKTGNAAKAVEWQSAAVAAIGKAGANVPDAIKKGFTERLDAYKAKLK
jgi:thiol-disulfide isomerase/thioredoxin